MSWISIGGDGRPRCWWPGDDALYVAYHDDEWGRPLTDDRALFEKMSLEGFQSGLSWLTILRKRENFRRAFANFDIDAVAAFGSADIERLVNDAGIVRHRGKIEAVIGNARAVRALREGGTSLTNHLWSFTTDAPLGRDGEPAHPSGLATTSPSSVAMSKDLKKRGFRFVGPTTMYSLMQSAGMINDHLEQCHVHHACGDARSQARRQILGRN